jgi:uncharacterized membrane protein YhdT
LTVLFSVMWAVALMKKQRGHCFEARLESLSCGAFGVPGWFQFSLLHSPHGLLPLAACHLQYPVSVKKMKLI